MSRFLKSSVCCLCLIMGRADITSAEEWRGIVPLRSTRADVARLYKRLTGASLFGTGLPQDTFNVLGEGMVHIQYSQGGCAEGWRVKRDTVVRVSVSLTRPIPFEELRAELKGLPRGEDDAGTITYMNARDGIHYDVQSGEVIAITYGPDERSRRLACKK